MRSSHCSITPEALRVFLVASLSFIGCALAWPQERASPPAPLQEPAGVLKVTTRLVTVDVVARDRRGDPVRDLTANEFEIAEQRGSRKSQQRIASFRLLDRALTKAPDLERAAFDLPAGVYTNLVTTRELSAAPTILLVDGLNTDAINQFQVRKKMVQLLGSAPADVPIAVFLLSRELQLLQNFTTDARMLKAAAERAETIDTRNLQVKDPRDDSMSTSSILEQMAAREGQGDVPGATPSDVGPRAVSSAAGNTSALLALRALMLQRFEREQYAASVDARVTLTLNALRAIARHVSGYPGRKNLIWISSSFPLAITPDANLTLMARFSGMRNYNDELTSAVGALTDAQVAVYPVDPRGMDAQHLFDADSHGAENPFSEGAALNRESNRRFSDQQTMEDLAQQTGGKVCLHSNDLSDCVQKALNDSSSYYELAYYPVDKNWHGEFRHIVVKTTRPGVQLSYRQGYFARESDPLISAKETQNTDARLSQAACSDFLTSTSILVEASALPLERPEQAKYFLLVDPNALLFSAPENGVRSLHLALATCMLNAQGLPLQYNAQVLSQKFTEAEYESARSRGISHTISMVPKPGTVRVRLLVCDLKTGTMGSVDLPYPAPKVDLPPAAEHPADLPSSPAGSSTVHAIKFHGADGRDSSLEWDSQKLVYSGNIPAEESAKVLFNSLWGKSFSCKGGALSPSSGGNPPQQPLHFRADADHSAEVYLIAENGIRYSGNVAVDPSAYPLFEALAKLYQCQNLVPQDRGRKPLPE